MEFDEIFERLDQNIFLSLLFVITIELINLINFVYYFQVGRSEWELSVNVS